MWGLVVRLNRREESSEPLNPAYTCFRCMAKESVSARVPSRVADSLEEYREGWNLSRTDAITVLLEYALSERPEPWYIGEFDVSDPAEGVYTVALEPEVAEFVEDSDVTPSEGINNVLRLYL